MSNNQKDELATKSTMKLKKTWKLQAPPEPKIYLEFSHIDEHDSLYKEGIKEFLGYMEDVGLTTPVKNQPTPAKKKKNGLERLNKLYKPRKEINAAARREMVEKTFNYIKEKGLIKAALSIDPKYRMKPIVCTCRDKDCECVLYSPYLNKLKVRNVLRNKPLHPEQYARYLCPARKHSLPDIYRHARKRFLKSGGQKNRPNKPASSATEG